MKAKAHQVVEFKRHLSPRRFKGLELGAVAVTADHAGISRSLQFVAQNFRQPIQISDLVTVSGLSVRGFTKAFSQHIGDTPGAYLQRTRIEHAQRLLTEQDLNLKQVAQQCGYRSENTFCVAFQRATKTSPKKFQRQYLLALFQHHRKVKNPTDIRGWSSRRLKVRWG